MTAALLSRGEGKRSRDDREKENSGSKVAFANEKEEAYDLTFIWGVSRTHGFGWMPPMFN